MSKVFSPRSLRVRRSVDRGERPLLAGRDDLGGRGRPDPGQGLQFRRGRGVEVDRAWTAAACGADHGGDSVRGIVTGRHPDLVAIMQQGCQVEIPGCPVRVDPRSVAAGRRHQVTDARPGRKPNDARPVDRPDDLDDQGPSHSAVHRRRRRWIQETGSRLPSGAPPSSATVPPPPDPNAITNATIDRAMARPPVTIADRGTTIVRFPGWAPLARAGARSPAGPRGRATVSSRDPRSDLPGGMVTRQDDPVATSRHVGGTSDVAETSCSNPTDGRLAATYRDRRHWRFGLT